MKSAGIRAPRLRYLIFFFACSTLLLVAAFFLAISQTDNEWMRICPSRGLSSSTATSANPGLFRGIICGSNNAAVVKSSPPVPFSSPATVYRPLITSPTLAITATAATFSSASHKPSHSVMVSPTLSEELGSLKKAFFDDVAKGDASSWTVVMGNEAGDLDSLASSIAFAILFNSLTPSSPKHVPIILTPRSFIHLRPENTLAINKASISPESLIFVSDLAEFYHTSPKQLTKLGVSFVLVDHNRLTETWLPESMTIGDLDEKKRVKAIIDHHADEGFHLDASPRKIETECGSCASLVALNFPSSVYETINNKEIATLLISSTLIDTGNLKVGGKGREVDSRAMELLYPLSTLFDAQSASFSLSSESSGTIPSPLMVYGKSLKKAKEDVSTLSTFELLSRDFKFYTHPSKILSGKNLKLGLATVPIGLREWVSETPGGGWSTFFTECNKFNTAQGLDILGILTTFNSKKGNHKREMMIQINTAGPSSLADDAAKTLLDSINDELSQSQTLVVEDWSAKKFDGPDWEESGGLIGKIWEQVDANATRKVVAPVLKQILEG